MAQQEMDMITTEVDRRNEVPDREGGVEGHNPVQGMRTERAAAMREHEEGEEEEERVQAQVEEPEGRHRS